MFDNYEELVCSTCETTFSGRRPADGVDVVCAECVENQTLPLIQEGDTIPQEALDEIERDGKGDE